MAKIRSTKKDDVVTSRQIELMNFKSNIIKFSRLYSTKRIKIKYGLIFLLGILSSLVVLFLIKNTGLYSSGFSGVFQGFSRLIKVVCEKNKINDNSINIIYNFLFWGLYFISNIPLLIFAYFKISKSFAKSSTVFLIFSQLLGFIWGFIPGIEDIFFFGQITNPKMTLWDNGKDIICLFLYGIISGLILGFLYSLIYILNSSTGGSDIISFYYAKIKNKAIGSLIMYINLVCIFISSLLGILFPELISPESNLGTINTFQKVIQILFNPNFLASISGTIVIGLLINWLFPKYKIIKISIYSDKIEDLKEQLMNSNYNHSISVREASGGLVWTSKENIETICMYLELPKLINNVRKVDTDALIIIQKIDDLDGKMIIGV